MRPANAIGGNVPPVPVADCTSSFALKSAMIGSNAVSSASANAGRSRCASS
jgi:hypothetical protein